MISRPPTLNRTDREPWVVNLPVYQGPLDLLLDLVRRNRMDIYDIPIAELTDQYIAHLERMETLNLELAGEFLVMASTLLEIKSRMLLPVPPPEDGEEPEDPRAELTRRLLEYEAIKTAAEQLRELESFGKERFRRGGLESAGEYPYDGPLFRNASTDALTGAFLRLLAEAAEANNGPAPLPRDRWTVSLKMREITALLHRYPDGVWFRDTIPPGACRLEIIVTFLAILELLKRARLKVRQKAMWSDIRLKGVPAE